MTRATRLLPAALLVLAGQVVSFGQQSLDPEFDPAVNHPAFTDKHPVVLFDEAHDNFHTARGRYKPFADLIGNDGFEVRPSEQPFSKEGLKGGAILIVANAMGNPESRDSAAVPPFTAAECDAVRDWVRDGGSLLLITDHHPWGSAAEPLAARFGVELGKSTTFDQANSETGRPGALIFSRENGLLGDHPILSGRDGSERVDRVLTFTGQSIQGPPGSTSLLKLGQTAVDQPMPRVKGRSGSAAGRSQGVAFAFGKGKVVVLGEAGMLSAQVNGRRNVKMGMNVPGIDNRQLGLNLMHWLAGLKMDQAGGVASKAMTRPAAVVARAAAPLSGRTLTSAQIAAQAEQSIALISGEGSSGTGFLVGPGLLVTNAHVIEDEILSKLRVRFPSAEKADQGPYPTELLYEDNRRDLAFLAVKSPLPPLHVAPSYKFIKGDDITVIGNPGMGGELILENAISRGMMSTRTTLDGQRFHQLGIAVNPGNSGGPVFDSTGQVIGVVSRKSAAQEALAFSIPVEDLNLALAKVASLPQEAINRARSTHRLVLVAKGLGAGGEVYSFALATRRVAPKPGAATKEAAKGQMFARIYAAAIAQYERQVLPKLTSELTGVRNDPLVAASTRDKVSQLSTNLDKLKATFAAKQTAAGPNDPAQQLIATHRRLIGELCKTIGIDVPPGVTVQFQGRIQQR